VPSAAREPDRRGRPMTTPDDRPGRGHRRGAAHRGADPVEDRRARRPDQRRLRRPAG
jgi:hypothetical protein